MPVEDASQRSAELRRHGILFVMTGASGVGKDTIRQAAMPYLDNLRYSVSATTRTRRVGEVDGVNYHYLEHTLFQAMIDRDELLEYADYVGDYYGTPVAPVKEALDDGHDVLLELELVGARQVKRRMPHAVMIFIAPPSLFELERRLRGRGTDSEAKIQKRLARAREEIRAMREFDYIIVNDEVDKAVDLFRSIIRAERARAWLLSDEQVAEYLREEVH